MDLHKMNTDPVVMVPFVQLIEKYPALYDTSSELYRSTDRNLIDAIWAEIAEKVGENVYHCKERWKNIRSSYSRWLRSEARASNGGRRKKEYYLAKYLHFLDSVPKSRTLRESKDSSIEGGFQSMVKAELLTNSNDTFNTPEEAQYSSDDLKKDEDLEDDSHEESYTPSADEKPSTSVRKRPYPQAWKTPGECDKKRHGHDRSRLDRYLDDCETKRNREEEHPTFLFFKSIMGDVRKLNSRQSLELKFSILERLKEFAEEGGKGTPV